MPSIRNILNGITPPYLLRAFNWIAERIPLSKSLNAPPPEDYTTVADPLEVPSQVESYLFCRDAYVRSSDTVLDVGFGLAYGINILATKSAEVAGIEVDKGAYERAKRLLDGHPRVTSLQLYDGVTLPFPDNSFNVVSCLEVIEHVRDYEGLLKELLRVSSRVVYLTTPNRRPEHTRPDGKPRNYWHIREWSFEELDAILAKFDVVCDWNFLNGPLEGPYSWSKSVEPSTFALVPVLHKKTLSM